VSEAEHGRAALALVDTALDAWGPADHEEVAAFRCGPTTVRIVTTGRRGADDRPFSHLPRAERRSPSPDHELVVRVHDGPFPVAEHDRSPAGELRARDERSFVAVTDRPPVVEGLRNVDGVAFSWIQDVSHAPPYRRFRPFAELFAAWFPTVGLVVLHAAAVGDADGVVLLVGNGGSGKSTTSVLCSRAGLGFLADDYCLLEPGDPPRAHSIYRSAKLRLDTVRHLPDVDCAPGDQLDGDHYFLVDEDATVVSAPVRAIVAVRPAAKPTGAPRLERVASDETFRLLMPTALKVASGGDVAYRSWLRAAHAMAATVPAFTLDLTWDATGVVDLVRSAAR
jgi:hypothetical protein